MLPETFELVDPGRPAWQGTGRRPIRVQLWSPSQSPRHPASILISHGTGGSASQMSWLSEPLADAGFSVFAVDHHGNNFVDGYLPEGFAFVWERVRDLRFALDWFAGREQPGPVGAAGFSLGGYTAAALLGARLDRQLVAAILLGHLDLPPLPEYPNLQADLVARVSPDRLGEAIDDSDGDFRDDRVEAAFLVSPAIGPLVTEESLAAIDRPFAVRWGGADDIAPPAQNALRYAAVPGADARSVGDGIGHYEFLASNPAGADVRGLVAADAVSFFRANLLGEDARPR